jgi:PAS domain S-box-containing protein
MAERTPPGASSAQLERDRLRLLHDVGARLLEQDALPALLEAVVEAAIEIAGSSRGTLQLHDEGCASLRLVAQRGFEREFLDFFAVVTGDDASACGHALRRRERVIVEDLSKSAIFLGTASMPIMEAAGVGALQSTPIVSRAGKLLGVFSTHSREPHRPDENALQMLDLLARQVADLIEHRQREEALLHVRQKLEIVTETMQAMVERCGRDLRYGWVSHALARWLGLPAPEIVGREIASVIGGEAFDALRPRFERVLLGETVELEERLDYAGRGARWIHVVYTPTRDAAGATDGWVSVITDITERKQVEQSLRDAARTKEDFLVFVSHDLRNPLNAIFMTAAALLKTAPDERVRKGAERIGRAVDAMTCLISDILDMAAISASQLRLTPKPCDGARLVREAVESLSPLATAKGLWLEARPSGAALVVLCDERRIQQVLGNLIGNAIKHSRAGTTISVGARAGEDGVRFAVADSGRGIPADQVPRLFERFFQAKPEGNGHGLGLYIAKGIVEAHGGRIGVDSMVSVGSTFWFTLPAE